MGFIHVPLYRQTLGVWSIRNLHMGENWNILTCEQITSHLIKHSLSHVSHVSKCNSYWCDFAKMLWNKVPAVVHWMWTHSLNFFCTSSMWQRSRNGWDTSVHLSLWSMCGCGCERACILRGCLSHLRSYTIHKNNILTIKLFALQTWVFQHPHEWNEQDSSEQRPLIQICQFPLRSITSHCESSRLGT